ncbi:erythromycin esterase family protein [Nocardia terpenica]|uniref:Erythromycin esterase n=1 Tax=Nocardia terpenica TaxID=455432 RepID=A0A164JN88_9NOCA|nr:erythromycin esterase family protein [Nocardia terpenica]KZM70565.1 erythromycin esterase [Nocardia terpenica]NQE90195.1 erythromycin esterase family protein [Nocardia terpenica]
MSSQDQVGAELAAWFRDHATLLGSLEVDDSLDDLEPLRDIVGDARIVAVGEGAHFVTEFHRARQRVVRFLLERLGFTVVTYEFGFGAGFDVDRWVQGETDAELAVVSPAAARWGASDFLHWLRRYNATAARRVRFGGIDLPEAAGSLRPVLDPVADYLREVDPDSLPTLDAVLDIADRALAGAGSGAAAAPAWAVLDPADQDAVTAGLARLLLRLRSLEPRHVSRCGRPRFEIARRLLEAATHTDYTFRAAAAMMAGRVADMSVREIYLAESVRWQLEQEDPDARMVLLAHNSHILRTPIDFGGTITGLPMGLHLDRMFGADYRPVALTHTAGSVPEMAPDPAAAVGFSLVDAELAAPEPGTVEAALVGAGLGERITLTDVRPSPRAEGRPLLDGILSQSTPMRMPVPDAFDAVLSVPTTTRDQTVQF